MVFFGVQPGGDLQLCSALLAIIASSNLPFSFLAHIFYYFGLLVALS